MTTQPEALRLAHWLERDGANCQQHLDAADELRRLHLVNQELLAALKALNSHGGMSAREQIEIERFVKVAIAKAERTTS
tara:strand:+ start:536 stop:772 length:237 start_codon:yes stop_codon:yes gene_type:complete